MRLYHGKAAWTRSIDSDNFSQNIYKVNSMHTPGISALAIWYEGILLTITHNSLAGLRHGVSMLDVQGLESELGRLHVYGSR